MEGSDEVQLELNEVTWWSNWTKTVWLNEDTYLLFSRDYPEYFFNRGGFLKVTDRSAGLIEVMEREFAERGIASSIFVQSDSLDSRLLQVFTKREYRIADQMSVMELETPSFETNMRLVVEVVTADKLKQWADVYLRAFYGSAERVDVVLATLEHVSRNKDVIMVLASLNEKPVGGLALFGSPGVAGVYCVGTVPEARGEHVASTLLAFANKFAVAEKRKLILQTILSDSVEPLYVKLGFRRLYLKELFVRDMTSTLKS